MASPLSRSSNAWEEIPPILFQPVLHHPRAASSSSGSGDGFGTHAAKAYFRLAYASKQIVPAFTSSKLDRTIRSLDESRIRRNPEILGELKQLMALDYLLGCKYDFNQGHISPSESNIQRIGEALQDANMLPLWVTGAVRPVNLLSAQDIIEYWLSAPTHREIQGFEMTTNPSHNDSFSVVHRKVTIFDGNLSTTVPEGKTLSDCAEFSTAMNRSSSVRTYLRFSLLSNPTSTRMTPLGIREATLQARYAKMMNRSYTAPEFFLASTTGAVSRIRMTTMGFELWLRPISGAYTLYLPTCSPEEAVAAFRYPTPDCDFPPGIKFYAINLSGANKGACWIQPPGQIFWAYTSETAFLVGGYFYTAATFDKSLRTIRRQLGGECRFTSDPTAEAFEMATTVVKSMMNIDLFTRDQRERVAHEARLLEYDWGRYPIQHWYKGSVRIACDSFISAVADFVAQVEGEHSASYQIPAV